MVIRASLYRTVSRSIKSKVYHSDASSFVAKVHSLEKFYDFRYKDTSQAHPHLRWQTEAFKTPSYVENFHFRADEAITSILHHSFESLKNYIFTLSYIAILPDEEKQVVADKLRVILEESSNSGEVLWVDPGRGLFEYPYRTVIVTARRNADN